MKVFAATAEGQGERSSDFCRTVEGELVIVPFECDADRLVDADAGCGCRRAVAGIASSRWTTTFRVIELEVTMEEFRELVTATVREHWDGRLDEHHAAVLAEEVVESAAAFDIGAVLEHRGDQIQPRLIARQALPDEAERIEQTAEFADRERSPGDED
jgi:hypothetical protein